MQILISSLEGLYCCSRLKYGVLEDVNACGLAFLNKTALTLLKAYQAYLAGLLLIEVHITQVGRILKLFESKWLRSHSEAKQTQINGREEATSSVFFKPLCFG